MFSVHQQTIRLYEKEGLINPKRSSGNTRLFSEADIDRLEEIIYLTHQVGINLAGVEMILKLKKKIDKMQREMNKLFDQAHDDLEEETEVSKSIISSSAKQLMKIKKEVIQTAEEPQEQQEQIFDVDNWEIEYEDD